MSLEHIFRNLNDIRVFDIMESFLDEKDAIEIYDILEILNYPESEIIQIEDSAEHLVRQKILCKTIIKAEIQAGCKICKYVNKFTKYKLRGHKDHVPYYKEMTDIPAYFMYNTDLVSALRSAVFQHACLLSEDD